jgi:hypothetical protein
VLRGEIAHALRIIHCHTAKQQKPEHQLRHDDLLGPPWLLHADARMVAPARMKLGLPNCVKLLRYTSGSYVLALRVASNSRKRLHQFVQNDFAAAAAGAMINWVERRFRGDCHARCHAQGQEC